MPLYDFKCGGCGAVQEVLQSYSAPPPTHCGTSMTRLASCCAFVVHGHSSKNGYNNSMPIIGNVGTQREVKTKHKNMRVTVTQK